MKIEDLIKYEIEYFDPIIKRNSFYSKDQLEEFRKETVAQRKKRVSLEIYDMFEGIVNYGPLKGLKMSRSPYWGLSDLGSILLGTYESEILDYIFNNFTISGRRTFIDIGAADGYYAIGLLKSGRVDRSICFEIEEKGRKKIIENHSLNGENGEILVFGDCLDGFESKILESGVDLNDSIVLVDIEGLEFSLLNEERILFLKNSIVLVEVHNWTENFMEKYEKFLRDASVFFDIEMIQRRDREINSIPELRSFTDDNRLLALSEHRPCLMRFLVLIPKNISE